MQPGRPKAPSASSLGRQRRDPRRDGECNEHQSRRAASGHGRGSLIIESCVPALVPKATPQPPVRAPVRRLPALRAG